MINYQYRWSDTKGNRLQMPEIVISYFLPEGNIKCVVLKIQKEELFNWAYCQPNDVQKDTNYTSYDGKPVKRVYTQKLNKYRIIELMHQKMSKSHLAEFFAFNLPKKTFFDIETEVIEGLNVNEAVAKPVGQVRTNAIFDASTNKMVLTGLIKLTSTQEGELYKKINDYFKPIGREFSVKYEYFESEGLMIRDFFHNKMKTIYCLFGWNSLKFDWLYLINRYEVLFGVAPTMCSPTNSFTNLSIADKWNRKKKTKVPLPAHRAIVDYMAIFSKWDTSVKLKSSQSLDYVASEVLGLTKIKYQGTLNELYERDIIQFLFYNAVDTILVHLIDEKLETFNTMLTLSNQGKVQLHDAAFASVIVETRFSKVFLDGKRVLVQKPRDFTKDDDSKEFYEEKESYTGGYVLEPKPGKFKGATIWDYESMFPSLMAMLNTGVEVLLGHAIMSPNSTDDKPETPTQYKDFDGNICDINSEIHTWTASGVVYDKTKDSAMRIVIGEMFDQRVDAKNACAAIDEEVAELQKMLDAG